MLKFRIKHAIQYSAVLAGSAFLLLAGNAQCVEPESPIPVTESLDAMKSPSEMGFIQRWLVLEPIPSNGLGDAAVKAAVAREYFPNQMTIMPEDGEKVTVTGIQPARGGGRGMMGGGMMGGGMMGGGGRPAAPAGDEASSTTELTWHAIDTNEYNVNLYYFANNLGKSASNVLFWVVTVVNCPEEMKDVRLAIGSNAASTWWVNGEEVIGIYNDRQTVIDDGVSKRLTLKKGANIIRGAVINAGGAADFCARILGPDNKPLKNFTVNLVAAK